MIHLKLNIKETMNLKLYILSIAVLLCTSCSKEVTQQQESVPVNFAARIEMPTKVGEYFEAGEKLGLFGYNYMQGGDISASTPDFMYNVPLVHNGDRSWDTEKTYFWSPNPERWKRFFAYYPYTEGGSSENITLSPASVTGAPYIDFTFTDGKTDFIVCEAVDGNKETTSVQFTAKHALAKLTIGFATDIEDGFAYAKAVKLNGVTKSARYSYGQGYTTFGLEKVAYDLAQPADEIVIDSNQATYIDEYTVYLLPNALESIETVINGVTKTLDLSQVQLAPGKNTSLRIVINQKEVSFTATIGDWETGGSASGTID